MPPLPVVNQPLRRSAALLDHVWRRIRLRSEGALAPLGLRSRHVLALTMLRDRGPSGQQDLARIIEMDGTNVVGLLNDLEARGLVERQRTPTDRRRHVVQITRKGANMLAKAEFALGTVEDEVLCALDPEQRETLYSLLQQATSGSAQAPCDEPPPIATR
jgi:DNA-binding MarR family transcriptional regulator